MSDIDIKYDFTILHFDEFPILFVGKNHESEIIMGSFIYEDDTDDTLKYFHVITSFHLTAAFLKRKISYLDVLKSASSIFIVTKNYNNNILHIENKNFSDIDKSFLPLSSSFCPKVENSIIFKFSTLSRKSLLTLSNNTMPKYTKQHKIQMPTIFSNEFISDSEFLSIHKSAHKNYISHV